MLYSIILALTLCFKGCYSDDYQLDDDSLLAVLPKVKESLEITKPSGNKDYVRPYPKQNEKARKTRCKHSCKGWPHEHCETKITTVYAHFIQHVCRLHLKM